MVSPDFASDIITNQQAVRELSFRACRLWRPLKQLSDPTQSGSGISYTCKPLNLKILKPKVLNLVQDLFSPAAFLLKAKCGVKMTKNAFSNSRTTCQGVTLVSSLSLFYICADNSGHLHHVDRLAFFHLCKVSDLA